MVRAAYRNTDVLSVDPARALQQKPARIPRRSVTMRYPACLLQRNENYHAKIRLDEVDFSKSQVRSPASFSLSLFLSLAKRLAKSLRTRRASSDGNRMRVEGLTSGSPRGGHKSRSREKAVGSRTKKRRIEREKERKNGNAASTQQARVSIVLARPEKEIVEESNPLEPVLAGKYRYRAGTQPLSGYVATRASSSRVDPPDLIRYCHANPKLKDSKCAGEHARRGCFISRCRLN